MPDERDRGEDPEQDGPHARQRRDDGARPQRALQLRVREALVVPGQGEPAERERRKRRVVEREDQQDHDRRVEEHHDDGEERPQDPRARPGEGDVHQPEDTCFGCRKREKAIVSRTTTPRRKIASTEPVSQSGKPVSKRSTIWLPYM